MIKTITTDIQIWVVAHNNIDIYHLSHLEAGQEIKTGQPFVEKFSTLEEVKNKFGDKIEYLER